MEGEERRLDRERDREAEEDERVVARPRVDEAERPRVTPNATTEASISSETSHRVDDEGQRRSQPTRPPQPTRTYSGISIASKET